MRSIRISRLSALAATLACLVFTTRADAVVDISAEVDRSLVTSGETLQLEVTISGDGGSVPDFRLPEIPGVVAREAGTQQNYQMLNGRISASRTWTYSLRVTAVHDFSIPALEIAIDGRTYRTAPISITVAPKGGAARSTRRSTPAVRDASPGAPAGATRFATLSVDRDTVYVGEQVVLSFRYYEDAQSRNFERPQYSPPRTEGFWREDLGQADARSEVIGGRRYTVTEIGYALFPTRGGALEVGPAKLVIPRDPFAGFFSRRRDSRGGPAEVVAPGLTIQARPLPSPRPAEFGGVVTRQMRVTTSLDRDVVPVGEAVSLSAEIVADGSLRNLTDLGWTAPDAVRLHDAGQSLRTGSGSGRLYSSLEQEWVLVPTEEGTLQLPQVSVVYFDPAAGDYRTASGGIRPVRVGPGSDPDAPTAFSGAASGELSRLADDLAFVHAPGGDLRAPAPPLVHRPVWWILTLSPILLLGLFRIYLLRLSALRRDPAGLRRRRALERARKALRRLSGGEDTVEGYASLAAAINGYVADRLGCSAAGLRSERILEHAEAVGETDAGRRLCDTVAACDGVRFAGGGRGEQERLSGLVADALKDLESLDRAVTSRGGARLALLPVLMLASLGVADAVAQEPPASGGGDPQRLVAEGNQAYTAGDLEVALERYRAADRVVDDPLVYYNLGNAHARRGEAGLAILNYMRGLRLDPRDADLRANLERIRAETRDARLHEGDLPVLLRLLTEAIGRVSRDEWGLAFALLTWWLALFQGFAWWRGGYVRWYRRILLGSTAVWFAALAICIAGWYGEDHRDRAVVVRPDIDVRSGPAESFPTVFKIHDGLVLQISERREGWFQVSLGGEWNGWVPAASVRRVIPESER